MSFLWGNTAAAAPEPRKFANISNDQINSNQQAQPVKYLAGRNYVAGDYISPAYNPKAVPVKTEAGKGESTTTGYKYYADFALVFCTGGRRPVDAIYKVIVDSDIRWNTPAGVNRTSNKEVIHVEDGKLGTIHLYWGTEQQPIDNILLHPRNASASNHQDKTTYNANHDPSNLVFGGVDAGDSDPYSGHYDIHPAYRGQCYAVFKDWKLGRDRTSVPNIQFELKRGCCWHSGAFKASDDRGVNPIAVLFEWLTDPRFGMALPESMLNVQSFNQAYNDVEALGGRISPMISSQSDFRQAISELLGYFDGWIRRNGTKLEVGVWAKGNIPDGPTLLDDDLLGEPELEPQGWGPTFNEVTVVYKDREHHFNDYTQVYRDPNNFRITGGPRPETLNRPWLTDADLAKAFARTAGAAMAMPFTKGELTVKREWLTTNSVLPGSVFTYDSGFYGLHFLLRLLEIEYASDASASAVMTVEWERSKWPSIYIPPAFQGPGGFVLGPRAIWQKRIVEVPYMLADQKFDTQLIVLAVRANVEVQGYRIWVGFANNIYNLLPSKASTSAFASFGRLFAQIGPTVGWATFHLFGVDQGEVVSQTNDEWHDDNLIMFAGSELMSVGQINSLGHGKYQAAILRGRYGTTKATHPADTNLYFLFRKQMILLDHAQFIPGTIAYFKLQPFTADLDYDITSLPAITYTIVGFNDIPPPVFTPAPGQFVAPLYLNVSNPQTGFTIRYTRDSTPVQWTSPIWPNNGIGNIVLNATKTIKARFFHNDSGRSSNETTGVYTKVTALPPGNTGQCARPTWTFSGVLHHSAGNLILGAVTQGSTIYWEKDHMGIVTTGHGAGPITIPMDVTVTGDTVNFWATAPNMDESSHGLIDNSKETTFGGGTHYPPRSPPNPV